MERTPEHLSEDPDLRFDFVSQMSWDEWAAVHTPFLLLPNAREIVEREMRDIGMKATFESALHVACEDWRDGLLPGTTYNEELYLLGYTTRVQREQLIEQEQAEFIQYFKAHHSLAVERPDNIEFREPFEE